MTQPFNSWRFGQSTTCNNSPVSHRGPLILKSLALLAAACAALLASCSSGNSQPTVTPTPTLYLPTPLPDDVLIENVREFLTNPTNSFGAPVDAEGDGNMTDNCLEVLEGGPDGFEWSVEQREDGQTVVRLRHSASLVEPKTGTWLAVPFGGVGTTSESLSCNAVPYLAYQRDNP